MLVGYVRVSTAEQNETRQLRLLDEYNVQEKFIDKESGKTANRKALQNMLDYVRKDDVVIVESISRIARNTKDLLNIIEKLKSKNVGFISIKENIDTTTPQGEFILTVFGALAQLERQQMLQRQREGIAVAKEEGKYKGKQKTPIDKAEFTRLCGKWRKGELTATAVMKKMDIKPNTFYRRVKEWEL